MKARSSPKWGWEKAGPVSGGESRLVDMALKLSKVPVALVNPVYSPIKQAKRN